MNRDEIVLQVNELMHKGFEIPHDKLTPAATLFSDLGMDSLDAIDMLVHQRLKIISREILGNIDLSIMYEQSNQSCRQAVYSHALIVGYRFDIQNRMTWRRRYGIQNL